MILGMGGDITFPFPPALSMKEDSMKKKNIFCVLILIAIGISLALRIWNSFINKGN